MKRTAWIVLVVVASLAWTSGPAAAQEGGPVMQVTVGFDGYCRRDGWCPVYTVLSNEGADVEGELRIAVGGTGGGFEPDVYSRQVVLPAHSRKAYFSYLPFSSSSFFSRVTVQLLAGDKVLSSEQVSVAWLDEEDRLYGVASGSPSALNFLNDVAPTGGRAAVAQLDLKELPPDPLGWEGLDVVVLNDVDTTVLSDEQRQALGTWVVHGGHLVVGGGAGTERTVAGVAELIPVAVEGVRLVDDLWALGEWLGAPTAAGPYAAARTSLRDGEVLVEQENLILWSRRTYGAGRVSFLAFDAGLNPFTRWDDNGRLWEWVVETRATGAQRLTVHNGYSAYDAINGIPGLKLPSILQILAFMLAYTLLIGPVNYVILRKLDRRELAWLTIPALILGFTICAYVTGFQIRGSQAIVHRLAAVYVPEGAGVGRVSQLVGIFSPRRTNYDVWVAGAGVRRIPEDYYSGPTERSLYVLEEVGGSTVANLRVDVGGIQPFLAEGYADAPNVGADLRLVSDAVGSLRLEGAVRSGETLLRDAVLIAGDGEQRLGDLEPGQAIPISVVIGPSLLSVEGMPERVLGPGDYWNDPDLYRRYQFLQAIFASYQSYAPATVLPGYGVGLGPGAYLIGWVEEQVPLPVEVIARPFLTVETALYVYALPVAGVETGATLTIPPGLIERQVVETVGYVDVWPGGFHMGAESGVTLRFTVWPGVMVRDVDDLVLDMQGASYGYASPPPTVLLWSQESSDWEPVNVGWGQHSIPNAGNYVTPLGVVLLRVETGEEEGVDVESLTIAIKGQR